MGKRLRMMKLAGGVAIVLGLDGCASLGLDGIFDRAATPDQNSARLVRMGDYVIGQGDPVTAASLYQQALAIDPDNVEARVRLGRLQDQLGATVSALDTYQQAVDRSPDDPVALRQLGNALIGQTYPERALTYLQRSLEIADTPQVRNSLGVALDLIGQHSLAQEQYYAGIDENPTDLGLGNNLALSVALSGDFETAVALARSISGNEAATSQHRQTFALVLGLAGRTDEAAAIARIDLPDAQVAANLDYYQLLRSIEPSSARAIAITDGMGAPTGGAAAQIGFAIDRMPGRADQTVMIATLPQ